MGDVTTHFQQTVYNFATLYDCSGQYNDQKQPNISPKGDLYSCRNGSLNCSA